MCHPKFSNELLGSKVVTNSLSVQKIGWNGNTGLKFTVDSLPIRFFGTLSVGLLGSLVGTLSVTLLGFCRLGFLNEFHSLIKTETSQKTHQKTNFFSCQITYMQHIFRS